MAALLLYLLPSEQRLAGNKENTDMSFKSRKVFRIATMGALSALLVIQLVGRARAEGREVTVHSSKIDITHGVGAEPIDQVDLIATFTNTEASEAHKCEGAADAPVTKGLSVTLQQGVCGTTSPGLTVKVPYFRPIAAGSTFARFEGTIRGASVDALLRTLPTPAGTCGMWNLTLDAVPVDLSRVNSNPLALTITMPDGSIGCVTVNNALIDQ